jgi:mono/diheme cytochrome c family protein
MTNFMKVTGVLATIVMLIILPIYMLNEPNQQEQILEEYNTDAIYSATDHYAENCAVCHGAAGEGIGDNPALDSDGIRSMDESELVKVISRGRDSTLMAGWALDEGGIFSNSQIDEFVTLIQQVNWEYVEVRITELGLTPPELITMEISDEMLSSVTSLPGGEILAEGLTVYAENCAACHGANGSGTVVAPSIDTEDLRSTPKEETVDLVKTGVAGTLMASWVSILPPEDINNVVDLIYRWPEILETGIEFPEVEVISVASSPEIIAEGQNLFNIACKSCHGLDGYGSRMAPALNNELFLSETPDAAIYQIIGGGVPGTLMPAWGSRLTDYDIQILVTFLRSLEESAPVIVPPVLNP